MYAIAHIRGSSALGREWYEDGKILKKKNSFTDLIASAEHLIQEGFTSKERLAIYGVSAGGLLVGACMTMRPDLFEAVIAKVPFVDVMTSMSDPTITFKDGRPAANIFAAGEIMAGNVLTKGYIGGIGLVIGNIFGRIAGGEAAALARGAAQSQAA